MKKILLAVFIIALCCPAFSQQTELMYLSGKGMTDTRTWDFYCTAGMQSGKWGKIEVPSQWELQGYGQYTFGRFYLDKTAKPSDETGIYKYKFKAPASWKDKTVSIVFEGSMTDTEVKINGRLAGEVHQGGFVRFTYDITDKLVYGKNNELEVTVNKESANGSVNGAERRADYWLFGGIYRPVYLKAVPKAHIERIAVDAAADGRLSGRLYLKNIKDGYSVVSTITPLEGGNPSASQSTGLTGRDMQTIETRWHDIKTWDCENPNLYVLRLELLDEAGVLKHVHEERIGFRTVEFRPRDGIYLNGTKIVMKGINRHCFHPDGGRTLDFATSLEDAMLIKEMNMNAVRSHYPPDKHFLDICDSLGIFYVNELPGWHNRYDETVGAKILKEMLARDVNHPCVVLWSNGNEGGWNKKLDPMFAELDPQKRHVIHPWADFNGLDTHHYPAYQTGPGRLANGYNVFMPTEFLHGQYDRGLGAGLEDFWASYTSNPLFAGGFLWTYIDEAVRRTDMDGWLDSDGPNGPDGIVGPYREKEGSFYTVREIWAPIQIEPFFITPSFTGEFRVTNDHMFTNLLQCTMEYRLYSAPSPLKGIDKKQITSGPVALPSIAPKEKGTARFTLPDGFFDGDILEIEAYDKSGRSLCTWTWPVKYAADYFRTQYTVTEGDDKATFTESNDRIILINGDISVSFSKADGSLTQVERDGVALPFGKGPLPVGLNARFDSYTTRTQDDGALFLARYAGAVDSIVWKLGNDGLLFMDAVMLNRPSARDFGGELFDKEIYHLGLSFSFPEEAVTSMDWLGRGPYRVWKNRIRGANFGTWSKEYNNTVTGESFDSLVYPEFKGYHGNMYWATLHAGDNTFTVYSETDGLYFRVFTPDEPAGRRNGENSMIGFPTGDLSFLYDIPAIRSFKLIPEQGPKSQPSTIRIKQGDDGLRMKLRFDFRKKN